MKEHIHRQVIKNLKSVEEWFGQQSLCPYVPFYSSFDMRDGGYKISNVDANLFPAGFNNICEVDREGASQLVSKYLRRCYQLESGKIILITEEHTKNGYYWQNVLQIVKLLEEANYEVRLCLPKEFENSLSVESATGEKLVIESWWHLKEQGFIADIVLSNNDFSSNYDQWESEIKQSSIIVNPPWQLGWKWRKKSDYFRHFNSLVETFAGLIDVDPWIFNLRTEIFSNFAIHEEKSREDLAEVIQQELDQLSGEYRARGIQDSPVVFVKNNSGTYGMGIVSVSSGEEFLQLNNKTRKKMKAAKGGGGIGEVIVQEGVPSFLTSDQAVAEPVLYLVGGELAGGFLRTHKDKGTKDNLNSPGAVYKRLCVSDLKIDIQGSLLENVYGWIAKLGVLALAKEIEEKQIELCNCQ